MKRIAIISVMAVCCLLLTYWIESSTAQSPDTKPVPSPTAIPFSVMLSQASIGATTDITFTIENAVLQDVLDALSLGRGWTATIPDPMDPEATIPNPVSQAAYAKQQLKDILKSVVHQYKREAAKAVLEQAAIDADTVAAGISVN